MNLIHKAVLRGFINLAYGDTCPSVSGTADGRACRYDEALSDRSFDRMCDRFYGICQPEAGTFKGFIFTSEGSRA